jgi:hypothetical protein
MPQTTLVGFAVTVADRPGTDAEAEALDHPRPNHNQVATPTTDCCGANSGEGAFT